MYKMLMVIKKNLFKFINPKYDFLFFLLQIHKLTVEQLLKPSRIFDL